MNIALKNIKVLQAASEETLCFSSSVYLEGKKVGVITNAGHGGPNDYRWTDKAVGQKIEEWTIENGEYGIYSVDCFFDTLVNDTLAAQDEKKTFKRWCKTKTIFTLKGDDNGSFRTIAHTFTQEVKDFLHRKHGEKLARIVNEEL